MKLKWYQLSDERIAKISDISTGFGNIMLASVVLPTILEKSQMVLMIAGIALTLVFWIISVVLLK